MDRLRRAIRHPAAPWIALVLATIAVWGNTLANGFVWDDGQIIVKDAGDLGGAERAWRAALGIDPRDAETLTQLGTLAAVRGDFAQAETLLRRAVESDPALATARANLGRVYDRTGRPAEALREYEAYLKLAGERAAEREPAIVERARQLRR